MTKPPTVGRPAKGFTPRRSQRWILAAALITAMIYTFRRLVEPSVTAAPARGGHAARVAGAGSPPPALGRWATAYGTGFLMLSIVSLGAPELAASIAMLMVIGQLLTNGTSIVADIAHLEGQPSGPPAANASAANSYAGAQMLGRSATDRNKVRSGVENVAGSTQAGLGQIGSIIGGGL